MWILGWEPSKWSILRPCQAFSRWHLSKFLDFVLRGHRKRAPRRLEGSNVCVLRVRQASTRRGGRRLCYDERHVRAKCIVARLPLWRWLCLQAMQPLLLTNLRAQAEPFATQAPHLGLSRCEYFRHSAQVAVELPLPAARYTRYATC